jgi:hypothetical protein
MSRLHRIIPLALATLVAAAPAAQAKLNDPNAIVRTPAAFQDLRSPDTRDHAIGYAPAGVQDLRSPDTRDAAAARPAPSATPQGEAIDTTTWALLAFAVIASGGLVVAVARSRRTRVPA